MRVAFYAPLKPPASLTPSGDRLIARLLMAGLESSGNQVHLASRFRSYDRHGDARRQARIKLIGERIAARLIRRYRAMSAVKNPQLWFTYHLFFKAPDWIGPRVSQALGIPYVVAEASFAPKQVDGPWAIGTQAVVETLAMADLVIGMSVGDAECVRPLLSSPDLYAELRPFIDVEPYAAAHQKREAHRRALSQRLGLDMDDTWLLTVAMMRHGDKVESYQILGRALESMMAVSWRLLVVGSGPAAADVETALSGCGSRVLWLGECEHDRLPAIYAACDAFLWPAVKETPGMCFLEAQAAGIPVVGGRAGGVPSVVSDGETGFLTAPANATDFRAATARLIDDNNLRRLMGRAAARRMAEKHTVVAAGNALNQMLGNLVA